MELLFSDPLFNILLVALLATIGFNIFQVKTRDKTWQKLIDDLKFTKGKSEKGRDREFFISGTYHRRKVKLSESNNPVVRNGRSKTNFITSATSAVKVEIKNTKDYHLTISRNIPRLGTRPQSKPTGIDEIDQVFLISSEPEDFALIVVNNKKIRPFMMDLNHGSLITVSEKEIIYDQTGRLLKEKEILFIFDFLCKLADIVDA